MSHFTLIAESLPVQPLLAELDASPDLWGSRKGRCEGNSPHRETSDVWARYARPEEIGEPGFSQRPHHSVWYTPEIRSLPSILDLTLAVRRAICGPEMQAGDLRLGGVLLTRIPAGKQVYPHHDRGSWHSEHYDLKTWMVLRGNDECLNTVEDESMVWKPGECWSHDNLRVHSVRNGGDSERIVLIMCFRRMN
jgi:mannose-6-phosphate isomerase-like protein (cupin superfamily)